MFFRNLTLFRVDADTARDVATRLESALADHPLRECGPLELYTTGFLPPTGIAGDPLTLTVGSCQLLVFARNDKLLPAGVVNAALRARVRAIEAEQDRRVGGRERKRLKEDVLLELLPRAFVQTSRTAAYIDTTNQWLVVDTASRTVAESVLTALRDALGSFPAVPLAPDVPTRLQLTAWLADIDLPAQLALGEECELRDPASASGAIAACRRQDMAAEEVKEHLRSGKQVSRLGLAFDDRLYFVLCDDLTIRKLRFGDAAMDELADADDALSELQATVALMTLELQRLFTNLAAWFEIPTPSPPSL